MDRVITDLCVFDVDRVNGGGLVLIELAEGVSIEEVIRSTGCEFKIAEKVGTY